MWTLLSLGREAEAIATCEEACRIDPLSDLALYHLCYAYWMTGEIENAERASRKLVSRTPDLWLGHMMLARALLGKGNPQEAVQAAELAVKLSGRIPMPLGVLGRTYAAAGLTNDAKDLLNELTRRFHAEKVQGGPHLAVMLIALGDDDKAIGQVRHSVHQGHQLFVLHFWPDYRSLWKDPRFIELVNQAGIARYNPETEKFEVVE